MAPRSPTYLLINDRLNGGLDAFITERRAANRSWRLIAKDIEAATGIDVTFETLRAWYLGSKGDAGAAA